MKNKSWFTVVELEVNSHCNRNCLYCPRAQIPFSSTPHYMSDSTFTKIIEELKRISFSGRLSYHFYNEPLLRSDFEDLVEYVSKMLPQVYQELYTNGDFLSDKRYSLLVKKGINHFLITSHENRSIPERPNQTVLFPPNLIISNRGGALFKIQRPLSIPCYVPSEMLIVTFSGDVLLCFEDVKRSQVMGNINMSSLEEIWFSERFFQARKLLKRGNRSNTSIICNNCNNKNYYAPDMTW